jgi:Asp-tRNA(Asn)/Glu-tRNA(Gln) amidotransferase A subunit family amidase
MLTILDIIAVEDEDCVSDFWRGQPFIKIPSLSSVRPTSYASLADSTALQGKRIAVPKMYIGKLDPAAQPVWTCEAVRHLWAGAASTLRSLGAVVEEVDFPLITNYEFKSKNCEWATEYPQPGDHYGETGPAGLFEHALHNFLAMVNDTSCVTKLEDVDHSLIFPQLPGSVQDRYSNRIHDRDAESAGIVQAMATRADDIFKVPGLEAHLKDLQARRKRDLDDWMEANAFDAVVWPAAGDVGPQDAETNEPSAEFAWRNGVWVSNGNLAIRQLGIPTVTVPMGLMEDKRMPVGLTFASKTYDDSALLSYASAFEKAHNKRPVPPRTPHLSTDTISGTPQFSLSAENKPPHLEASAGRAQGNLIQVSGRVDLNDEDAITVQVFVDGIQTSPVRLENGAWMVSAEAIPYVYATELPGAEFRSVPEQEKALVVVVATSQQNNRSTGKLIFI